MIKDLVKLKYLSTGSDEISYYETISFQQKPVLEYIKAILDDKSGWGDISLFNLNNCQQDHIEYRYGIIKNEIINDWSNKIVTKIQYSGGWSYSNWQIITKDIITEEEINE